MGGNSSFSDKFGRVPDVKHTHEEINYCIERHKVLLTKGDSDHIKNVLNSNSANAIYIIANTNKKGYIEVKSINVYQGHHLHYEINLNFDIEGNSLPFNEKGSHAHIWEKNEKGELTRKKHDKKNTFPIDPKYNSLIKEIEKFNKDEHRK